MSSEILNIIFFVIIQQTRVSGFVEVCLNMIHSY